MSPGVRARLKTLLGSWLVLQIGFLPQVEAELYGPNVCQKEIIVPKEITKWELRNRTTRTYKWCMNVPPRCSFYSTKVVNESRTTVVNETASVATCCDGYGERGGRCLRDCPKCMHGFCLSGDCVCTPGWTGSSCEILITTTTTSTTTEKSTEYYNLTLATAVATTPSTTTITAATTATTTTTTTAEYFEGSGLKSEPSWRDEHQVISLRSPPEDDSSLDYEDGSDDVEESIDPIAEEDASAADYRDLAEDIFENSNSVKDIFEAEITTKKSTTPELINEDQDLVKENLLRHSDNLLEGNKYAEKRSSVENLKEEELAVEKTENKNLIYSICAASLTTFLILVVVVTMYAVRNSRKKVEKGRKGKKEVASVAVYTSSIFHTPLPDPPMFDNPTYLVARPNVSDDPWNTDNKNNIEAQEFNVVFQKPLRNPKLVKHYLYDHPPSTGSYRASSDIDALSQYSFSQKNIGIVSEPVYDEIPSKQEDILNMATQPSTSSHYTNHTINKVPSEMVNSNSLYMNTCGRTPF